MDDLTQFQEMLVAALGKAGDDLKKKIEDAVSGGSVDSGIRGLRNELRKLDKLAAVMRQLDKARMGTPVTAPEKRAQRVVTSLAKQRQKEEESAEDQRDRVLGSLGRQRRMEEAAYRRRRRRVMARLRKRRGRQELEALKAMQVAASDQLDGIHMGRLPIASVPAALLGNRAAGARVGYALGERSGFGRWAGLGVGLGAASAIGAGFAASPSGTDVITKPLTILAATIGAVVLPALVQFGAVLLDVSEAIRGKMPNSLGETALTVGAGLGAYKLLGAGGAAAGGSGIASLFGAAGAGAMGAGMGAVGWSGIGAAGAGAAWSGAKALGTKIAPIAGAVTAADAAAGLFGHGSTAGRTGWQKALQYGGGILGGIGGFLAGGPAGAALGASAGWYGGGWLGGDTPEMPGSKRATHKENVQAILNQMIAAMGTPKIGTDFEQMNRDIQMATMQSDLDARLLRIMQEALDPMLKEQRETNQHLRPK